MNIKEPEFQNEDPVGIVRKFDTGATRDTDQGKLDFEGFLSPLVLERFAEYMHENRLQSDGTIRDSDNWQKGIPQIEYAKSEWRHHFDFWKEHRGIKTAAGLERALCGILFNVSGYLHEHLKKKSVFHQTEESPALKENQGKAEINAEISDAPEPESECCHEPTGILPGLPEQNLHSDR